MYFLGHFYDIKMDTRIVSRMINVLKKAMPAKKYIKIGQGSNVFKFYNSPQILLLICVKDPPD